MFLQRHVKRPLHPWLLTLFPNKKDQKKKPFVNDRELPIFQAPCPSLGAAFPFSLTNPTLCADLVSWVIPLHHKSILWPVKARILNTGLQHFWWPWRDTSSGPRSVWLSTKPAGVCLRCDREPLAPCWILMLGETPCWGITESRLSYATPPSLSLSDSGSGGALCSLPVSRDQT
jgi:hypothetical protein